MENKNKISWMAICGVATVIFLFAAFYLGNLAFSRGGDRAKEAFTKEKERVENEKYDMFFENAFDEAEKKYHVENKVYITIDSIQEMAKLEVLEVSDVEYAIKDPGEGATKVASWLEIPGKGVFTVDLSLAEFIVENERRYVKVRLPKPELTECTIDYDHVRTLFWKDSYRNYSYSEGEELAESQLNEGYVEIRNYINSNQKFYQSARTSAENMIKFLVKELNPDVPELVVEVEFID